MKTNGGNIVKRFIKFFSVFILALCLSACSDSSTSANDTATAITEAQTTADNSTMQSDDLQLSEDTESTVDNAPADISGQTDVSPNTDGKPLVVYFSHSGNTRSVANEIALQTGADIFEIVPAEPYTTDYDTLLEVARTEKADNARPEISGTLDNLDDYDTIYLGYPNWWADMPMVMYTFLDTYDLSGKTVSPFVTSGGSGFSGTVDAIRSLEPEAVVTEGLAVRDTGAGDPAEAVSDWLNSLN